MIVKKKGILEIGFCIIVCRESMMIFCIIGGVL
jgi:hypothetical protein